MKNLLIVLLLASSLLSCTKKSTDSPTTTTPIPKNYDSSFVSFRLNGVAYNLSSSNEFVVFSHFSSTDKMIYLSAHNDVSSPNYGSIIITLKTDANSVALNTPYDLRKANIPANPNLTFSKVPNIVDLLKDLYMVHHDNTPSNGTVTITKTKVVDVNLVAINGTFSATVANSFGTTMQITEGEFFDIRTK